MGPNFHFQFGFPTAIFGISELDDDTHSHSLALKGFTSFRANLGFCFRPGGWQIRPQIDLHTRTQNINPSHFQLDEFRYSEGTYRTNLHLGVVNPKGWMLDMGCGLLGDVLLLMGGLGYDRMRFSVLGSFSYVKDVSIHNQHRNQRPPLMGQVQVGYRIPRRERGSGG